MVATVQQKDARLGITYVHESACYWDKDKQQSRSRRRLIGRVDETTGEVVPTDGRGRKEQAVPLPRGDLYLQRNHPGLSTVRLIFCAQLAKS